MSKLEDILSVFTDNKYCEVDDCLNSLALFHCPYSDTRCNEHCGHDH